MNTNDLLKTVKNFFDTGRREQVTRYKSLKRLMKKLKVKQNILKEKIKNEDDEKIKRDFEGKIKVIKKKKKKGLKLLKELKGEI